MRLLARCGACARQFDASDLLEGTRFRCPCGTLVEVPAARGHDARVVRCSSCGGARQGGANACSYCSADFTLFEQDRNTVCASCFVRVSDAARFCHHCGEAIGPEQRVGEGTERACPACEPGKAPRRLRSRSLGEGEEKTYPVLECNVCAGLWVGLDTFAALAARARTESPLPMIPRQAEPAPGGKVPSRAKARHDPEPGTRFYRKCPVCDAVMNRVNYGHKDARSGVIVDVCGRHGIWFDDEELVRVLQYLHHRIDEKARRQSDDREARRRLRESARTTPRLDATLDSDYDLIALAAILFDLGGD